MHSTRVMFAKKVIDGAIKLVQHIRYSNGTVVERVFSAGNNIPEEVRIVDKCKNTAPYNHRAQVVL